jgi:hypothetical protein
MMLCCGIGALAAVSAAWSGKRAARSQLLSAVILAGVSLAFAAFATAHLGHYVTRAQANERTLLAEIMAQPVCTDAADTGRQVRNPDQSS